jgi:hypothetical protein
MHSSSTASLTVEYAWGPVADQRPGWLAVAGELVDCGGSVQASRAGNEDCHGHRLLVEVGLGELGRLVGLTRTESGRRWQRLPAGPRALRRIVCA